MSDDEDYNYYDSDEEVQEIEVDDEYEDDEVEEETSQKEPDFVVLTIFDVIQKQQEEVEKITEVLGVSNASARVLLRKFEWKVELIMNTFFEKELNGVLKIAGITMEDITFGTEDETTEEIFECPLCYDDVPMEESTKLGCSHRFCNNCWQQYVELTITEGQSRNMKCMGFKCNESVDELVIVKLIKNKKLRAKYERNIVESYIEDNKNVKWCSSTPPCGSCIQSNLPGSAMLQVKCTCNHEFCFRCGEAPHLPATCEMAWYWKDKMVSGELEETQLNQSIKKCPKCSRPVEKNGGCNHMSCVCGYHWCWLCTNNFDGYGHTCPGQTAPTAFLSTETVKYDELKQRLEEYGIFLRGHDRARRAERRLRKKILAELDDYKHERGNVPPSEIALVNCALETLMNARVVLRYSTILEFFVASPKYMEFKELEDMERSPTNSYQFSSTVSLLTSMVTRLVDILENPISKVLAVEGTLRYDMRHAMLTISKQMCMLFDDLNAVYYTEQKQIPLPRTLMVEA